MAIPMTASQIKAALTKWGVPFKEIVVGGVSWANHNRAGHGAWGPLNGFLWHHTGQDVTDGLAYARGTLWGGIAGLPGPLCHIGLGPDGTAYLVGWGRANHAGGGDPDVLQHVINEDYTGILKPHKGNADGVDGNAHFYGMEIMYSGSHGMTPAQYSSALKISAAILDFHKWTAKSVIGHGEWSDDKWDPGYAPNKMMDMNAVRNDIADVLGHRDLNADGDTTDKGEPNAPKTPAPTPAPVPRTLVAQKGDIIKIGSVTLEVKGL